MNSRLSPARIVGIAAWTAASVMWGAAAVAFASKPPEVAAEPPPLILALPETTTTIASVPTMPETGLVVLRYTPVARPEAEVIVREVRVAGPASSSPAASAPARKPTKTTSSGS